ncbi:MAG: hypothetical protein M0R76_08700, partial [Proteobacteria bacterium]|nr:hypothetical protein [Pseudomonadota bacterium]
VVTAPLTAGFSATRQNMDNALNEKKLLRLTGRSISGVPLAGTLVLHPADPGQRKHPLSKSAAPPHFAALKMKLYHIQFPALNNPPLFCFTGPTAWWRSHLAGVGKHSDRLLLLEEQFVVFPDEAPDTAPPPPDSEN